MILLDTDYIVGFVGLEGPAPAATGFKGMTTLVACVRRGGDWFAIFDFLYTNDGQTFSPKDEHSAHIVPLPKGVAESELWPLMRDGVRAMARQPTSLHGSEPHELAVHGSMDKLQMILATAPASVTSVFRTLPFGRRPAN